MSRGETHARSRTGHLCFTSAEPLVDRWGHGAGVGTILVEAIDGDMQLYSRRSARWPRSPHACCPRTACPSKMQLRASRSRAHRSDARPRSSRRSTRSGAGQPRRVVPVAYADTARQAGVRPHGPRGPLIKLRARVGRRSIKGAGSRPSCDARCHGASLVRAGARRAATRVSLSSSRRRTHNNCGATGARSVGDVTGAALTALRAGLAPR